MSLTMLVGHVDDGGAYGVGSHGLFISDLNTDRSSIRIHGSE